VRGQVATEAAPVSLLSVLVEKVQLASIALLVVRLQIVHCQAISR
jgi:hypothetical protein